MLIYKLKKATRRQQKPVDGQEEISLPVHTDKT